MKRGKKYLAALDKIEPNKKHTLQEAVSKLKEVAFAKFDETVELTMWLGVDPRKADQLVRGTIVLPHGLGGTAKKIVVIAQGDKIREAEEAGADMAGGDDLVEKIKGGWIDFDALIATPDMMGKVGQLGKVLGPRGLMPNPKTGTVTMDVKKAIEETKAGKVEYRVDKAGVVHCRVGRISFEEKALSENAAALVRELLHKKPATAKGTYLKSITVSSTMGPGVRIDTGSVTIAEEAG